MGKIRNILVIVDRDPAALSTFLHALALARCFGASVKLFLCDAERGYALNHQYDSQGVEEVRENCIADSRRFLETLRDAAPTNDVKVTFDASCESPLYEGIVREVRRVCPDLVIKGVDGVASNAPAGLNASDWALVRTCPAPILLTRGRRWRPQPSIAAAVDISQKENPGLTKGILQTAASVSTECHGTLEVLHWVESSGKVETRNTLLRDLVDEAGAAVQDLHVITGSSPEALITFVTSRAYDIVVLGALTHRKALTAMPGTLTAQLVDKVHCDLLLVKSADYVCPVQASSSRRHSMLSGAIH